MNKPKAYKNVDLDVHLAKVGEAVALTGYDILTAHTPVSERIENFTKVKDTLLISSIIAGAFHDIGKASELYQKKKNPKSFYLHEYLSGILLYYTAYSFAKRGKYNLACIFNLSAWSVVRHHAAMWTVVRRHFAMGGRHPKDIVNDNNNNKKLSIIMEALKEFNITVAKEGLPDVIKGSKLYNELQDSWREISNIDSQEKLRNKINELVVIRGPSPMVCKLNKDFWISAVEIVTGPVIMGDILVSEREGRESDDNTSRLYSKYWVKELGIEDKLDELMKEKNKLVNLKKAITEIEKLL